MGFLEHPAWVAASESAPPASTRGSLATHTAVYTGTCHWMYILGYKKTTLKFPVIVYRECSDHISLKEHTPGAGLKPLPVPRTRNRMTSRVLVFWPSQSDRTEGYFPAPHPSPILLALCRAPWFLDKPETLTLSGFISSPQRSNAHDLGTLSCEYFKVTISSLEQSALL